VTVNSAAGLAEMETRKTTRTKQRRRMGQA
jgi:hypothetical protein